MGPFIRIALRYLSGLLIAKGMIGDGQADIFTDPDLVSVIVTGLGFAMAAATEFWYALSRKFGWSK